MMLSMISPDKTIKFYEIPQGTDQPGEIHTFSQYVLIKQCLGGTCNKMIGLSVMTLWEVE